MRLESPTSVGMATLAHVISVLSYCDHKHYFSKYEKVEKTHQEVLDETKLCREILAVADSPSEDEVVISCMQENLNATLQEEEVAQKVMSTGDSLLIT